MGVSNLALVALAFDVVGNILHRSGTIQTDSCYYVFQSVRLHTLHQIAHSSAFQLENTHRVPRTDEFEHFGIRVIRLGKVYGNALRFFDVVNCLFDVGKGTQSQKVHFSKPACSTSDILYCVVTIPPLSNAPPFVCKGT